MSENAIQSTDTIPYAIAITKARMTMERLAARESGTTCYPLLDTCSFDYSTTFDEAKDTTEAALIFEHAGQVRIAYTRAVETIFQRQGFLTDVKTAARRSGRLDRVAEALASRIRSANRTAGLGAAQSQGSPLLLIRPPLGCFDQRVGIAVDSRNGRKTWDIVGRGLIRVLPPNRESVASPQRAALTPTLTVTGAWWRLPGALRGC